MTATMSTPVRVLVVDDSAYIRKVVKEMLSRSPALEVVGTRPAFADENEERVTEVEEHSHGTAETFLDRHVANPGRRQPLVRGLERDTRQLVEQPPPIGEVAVDGCACHTCRGRDISQVRAITAAREGRRRSLEDGCGHALLQRRPRSQLRRLRSSLACIFGHRA